jgi:hypothetical protein
LLDLTLFRRISNYMYIFLFLHWNYYFLILISDADLFHC